MAARIWSITRRILQEQVRLEHEHSRSAILSMAFKEKQTEFREDGELRVASENHGFHSLSLRKYLTTQKHLLIIVLGTTYPGQPVTAKTSRLEGIAMAAVLKIAIHQACLNLGAYSVSIGPLPILLVAVTVCATKLATKYANYM